MSIQLVTCDRFECRLMLERCIDRYKRSSKSKRPDQYRGIKRSHVEGCRGCPQGKARSGNA